MKKPYYSIGIIFKNEIRCLERCLKSLQPLRDAVPCELVMADTGSTDGSREVAEKYADILFDFPWIDDFAAARNAVMDRCSGQWYLSIDADEWLSEDITELIAFRKAKKTTDYGGIMIRNYRVSPASGTENYLDFTGIRLARLKPEIRYEGVIHESFRNAAGSSLKVMILSQTWYYHDGYIYDTHESEMAKHDRNLKLLKKKLENNPQDFQTLIECVDCLKYKEYDLAAQYCRELIKGLREEWEGWSGATPQVLHIALSAAMVQGLPEFEEWLAMAQEQCPDSIFTRVDVSYYAFAYFWKKRDYEKVVHWGEAYERGIADYQANRFNPGELMRSVLENIAPVWIRMVAVLLPQAYLECDMPEKAFAGFRKINGSELEDVQHVELCTQVLMRLHRTTELDAASLMATFWEQVNRPRPDEEQANRRRRALLRVAENAFRDDYRQEEEEREDYLRHSFTVFLAAAEDCPLRHAAATLVETEPARLAQCLAKIDDWTEVPIAALAHALEWGAAFPLMEKQLYIEKLDLLAGRLAQDQARFFPLACRILETEPTTEQELLWQRGVAIAAVRVFAWQSEEADAALGLRLARGFANAEREFLPLCYAPGCFAEGRLYSIAPMHRFGWHCARAFAALDSGDAVGYVRQLRAGLSAYEGMKPMAQFLMDHTPALAEPSPSAELKALADQVRGILSRFAPDDPAAVALKSSEAYQKVAYLIEGAAAPVMGRALQ